MYPVTLINKGFELVEKNTSKKTQKPKKHSHKEPLLYVPTYNKNNSELRINFFLFIADFLSSSWYFKKSPEQGQRWNLAET